MRKRLLGLVLLLGCIAVKPWSLQAEEVSEVKLGEAIEAEDLGISTYATPIVMDRTRTRADIAEMALQLPHTGFNRWLTTEYAVAPNLSAPYSAGSLTQAAYNDALNTLKMVRYIAGLPYENVQFTPELNSYSQHGAVLLAASNQFTHRPTKPADMEETFYQAGYTGTSEGNISWGDTNISNAILGFIADPGMNNIGTVGHRRWILAPGGQDFGIGYASGAGWNHKTVMHVFEGMSWPNGEADTYVAWPSSGDFPLEYFTETSGYHNDSYCWSVNLGSEYFFPDHDRVSVTLTRVRDGKIWYFDKNTPWLSEETTGDVTGMHFSVDNSLYGMTKAIVFRPDLATLGAYQENDVFHVKIEGIEDYSKNPKVLEYTVNFFDLDYEKQRALNPVTSVVVDKTNAIVKLGDTLQLNATALPNTALDRGITYSSSNTSIATVDNNGIITAKAVGTVTITATSVHKGHTASCAVTVEKFYDVYENWQKLPIENVYNEGLMVGKAVTSAGAIIFGPEDTLKREEFVQILYNQAGKPSVTYQDIFTDLTDGQWYSNAVVWAKENGIVAGYENGEFGIGDSITREQLIVMLQGYMESLGVNVKPTGSIQGFVDANKVSDWALIAMEWAIGEGYISGKANSVLDPRGNATRAECATIASKSLIGLK